MPEVMSGIPISPSSMLLVYAAMWAVVVDVVLFSVGSGLAPREERAVHEIHGKPAPKEESQSIRHAA